MGNVSRGCNIRVRFQLIHETALCLGFDRLSPDLSLPSASRLNATP